MLFLPDSEEFNDMHTLNLSRAEIGKGRILPQIHIEREDYLREFSKEITTDKKVKPIKG